MERRHFSSEIYQKEEELFRLGKSSREIQAALEREYGDKAPNTHRTVERHLRNSRQDTSGDWTIDDAMVDARVVLDFQRQWLEGGGGWRRVTKNEGRWLERLSRAAPGLSGYTLFQLTREYLKRTENQLPTWDLDAWLAFAPWQSDDRLKSYEAALSSGEVPSGITPNHGPNMGADWFQRLEMSSVAFVGRFS